MASDLEERIRARAHAIWEEEGRPDGRADEHWARATREVEAAVAAETPEPVEPAEAPAARKPAARKAAARKAEPAPEVEAEPAGKAAAPRKSAAPGKSSKPEAAPETPARKPRTRKSQPA